MVTDDIAYQNKDIVSKVFADTFGEKSLNVYGLNLPRVRRLLPTNLPAIAADERRIDDLFELEDDSVAIVDYESAYDENDKIKYGNYLIRVSTRYQKAGEKVPPVRMIVIYTADVKREQVCTEYDRKGYVIRIEPAFLSELNSEEIRTRLNAKVQNGEKLTDEELMEFIILPLSYETREKKQEILKEAVALAANIEDKKNSTFVLSGLLVFSDKIIDARTRGKIKELLHMTQIEKMWWDEAMEREKLLIAEKDAEIKAKDAEIKAKDVEIKAKDAERAQLLVHAVDNVICNSRLSLEDACRMTGFTVMDYANSYALLGQLKPKV